MLGSGAGRHARRDGNRTILTPLGGITITQSCADRRWLPEPLDLTSMNPRSSRARSS